MAVKHLDGCPKSRPIEKKKRKFMRGGTWMVSNTERCQDCGARTSTKPRKSSK